jgi:hypothetical protein
VFTYDSLYRLIKRLTAPEKRFLLRYIAQLVPQPQKARRYTALFRILDDMTVFEETVLSTYFSGIATQRIAKLATRLYRLLLNGMNTYHAPRNTDTRLCRAIGHIAFLHDKGLHEQALQLTTKAYDLATQNEKWSFIPLLSDWQKRLIEALFYTGFSEDDFKRVCRDEQNALNKLANINEYWLLQAQLYYHHNSNGIARAANDLDKIAAVFQHSLLRDEERALCFDAKLLLYKIYSTYFFIVRDITNCYKYTQKTLALLEAEPHLQAEHRLAYIHAINNMLNLTGMMNNDAEREHYLACLEAMWHDETLLNSEAVRLKLFEAHYYHQMTYYISQNRFDEGLILVRDMQQGMTGYGERLDKMGKIMLCFYGFHICFGAEQYEQANEWLQQIVSEPENSHLRQDIYTFAQILRLIVVYEMGNKTLLCQTIDKVSHFLDHKKRLYQFETLVLGLLHEVKQQKAQTDNKALFTQFLAQLQQLSDDSFERKAFAYFDFPKWLQAKIVGQSFGERIKTAVV